MFKKTIGLVIDSWYAMEFMSVIGELGLEFRFGGEHCYIDDMDPRRKHYYRRWAIRGNRKTIDRLIERLYDKRIPFRYW